MTDTAGIYANDPLMRAVALSIDVEHFLTHDKVGSYLMLRAIESRADALEELAQVSATDYERIRELQWQARIPDLFQAWLQEAKAAGMSAEETIQLEEQAGHGDLV
jgi:hypothetical protein